MVDEIDFIILGKEVFLVLVKEICVKRLSNMKKCVENDLNIKVFIYVRK